MSLPPFPLLRARDLSIAFGDAPPVVHGVSFDIYPGQVLALVGESGSGKSLTSLSIPRLFAPGSGARITNGELTMWDGAITDPGSVKLPANPPLADPGSAKPSTEAPLTDPGSVNSTHSGSWIDLRTADASDIRRVRRSLVGMVFQEPMASLNPVLPIGRQIAEALPPGLDALAETQRLLSQVQLPHPANLMRRYPHELSGGQQQRVMIAMALARRPRLLLADEPTTALDATIQHEVLRLLRDLQQEAGLAMLFVSHDLGVVAQVADAIAVMQAGRIVEQGPVHDILHSPKHPYTQGLLACRPRAGWHPRRLPTVADYQDAGSFERDIANTCQSVNQEVSAGGTPLLDVQHLTIRHVPRGFRFPWQAPLPPFVAVHEVSLTIAPGEKVGIVGESGCGKSTLARAISGLQTYSGTIRFQGEVLPVLAPQRSIQMIFQDPMGSLNPRRTVAELLTEPMALHGIGLNHRDRLDRAASLLRQVGLLPEHLRRYPAAFSGGQRQRICIARAIGLQPSLLICDESVAALDVSVQAQVLNLLNDLREELGLAILFISHDLNVVRYFTSRILVMQAGQVVEEGDSEALLANPQAEATRRLVAAIPAL